MFTAVKVLAVRYSTEIAPYYENTYVIEFDDGYQAEYKTNEIWSLGSTRLIPTKERCLLKKNIY